MPLQRCDGLPKVKHLGVKKISPNLFRWFAENCLRRSSVLSPLMTTITHNSSLDKYYCCTRLDETTHKTHLLFQQIHVPSSTSYLSPIIPISDIIHYWLLLLTGYRLQNSVATSICELIEWHTSLQHCKPCSPWWFDKRLACNPTPVQTFFQDELETSYLNLACQLFQSFSKPYSESDYLERWSYEPFHRIKEYEDHNPALHERWESAIYFTR